MQMNGAGEVVTPFSKFVDLEEVGKHVKHSTQPASQTLVSTFINLTETSNKRSLKTHLRENLHPANHDIRSVLYKRLVRKVECNESMFGAQMYTDFENEHLIGVSGILPPPSFCETEDIPNFCLNGNGKATLMKVLNCINYQFPQVTYSPLLPVAVALFLHYDEDPAQVFSHVCRLIFSNSKSIHYLDANKKEVDASTHLLKELTQKYSNASHKSLLSLTSNPDNVYSQWIRCLFHGLPFTYTAILFDMYLLEGYKALYRLSLSVLKFYRKMGVANASDIVSAVFNFNQNIESKVSINMLFRKAFGFKLPPSKEINRRHRKMLMTSNNPNLQDTTRSPMNQWTHVTTIKQVESEIASQSLLTTLYKWLPDSTTVLSPVVLFSTNKHGYNLTSFFSCCDLHEPTVLLIKTVTDAVIGAYLSTAWEERINSKGYFGTGESFVFKLLPEPAVYKWSGITKSTNKIPQLSDATPSRSGSCSLPPINVDTTPPPVLPKTAEPLILPPLVGAMGVNRTPTPYPSPQRDDLFMMADKNGIKIGGGGGISIAIDTSLLNGISQPSSTFNNPSLVGENGTFVCSMIEVIGFHNA
uniref:TBC1 domain family member 24-like n=1 Tax=Ciona intestinalis TaxID=7719 RepID=UPI000180CC5C|nr:TBC1 domain family member 24-like [Ciona intestinalis]|eukprot:XP_009858691.1 TBC1 domain family member 24-like [Ciona intestinalis]